MNEQTKKSRWVLILIVGLSVVPLVLAWFYAKHPDMIPGRTNYGRLIIPPVPLDRGDLTGFDRFSAENLGELKGRWVLLHVIGPEGCGEVCRESLYKTKQLRLMLSKDLTRVRRLAVLTVEVEAEKAQTWWAEDAFLLRATPGSAAAKSLEAAVEDGLGEGALLLMDPLGNLMMRYAPGFDPYGVRKDLARLLNVSQIG